MNHSSSFDCDKERSLNALTSETSVRVVLATSAVGCGVDMKNIQYVIHFGPAFDTVDYCQQIGRAGRNTGHVTSYAILYVYPGSTTSVSKKMISYIKSKTCLRVSLFSRFNALNAPIVPVVPDHLCCSVCQACCTCGNYGNSKVFFEELVKQVNVCLDFAIITEVSEESEQLIRELLYDYRKRIIPSCPLTPTGIISTALLMMQLKKLSNI